MAITTSMHQEDAWDRSRDALDDRLSMVHVEARPDEDNDDNFPRNLHNAVELFLTKDKLHAAKRLQDCALNFLRLVEQQPQAETVKVGQARICWACGHCGLASDAKLNGGSPNKAGACSICGDAQTNFVQVVPSNGGTIPWMEAIAQMPKENGGYATKQDLKIEETIVPAMKDLSVEDDEDTIEGLDERLVSFQVVPNDGEDAHPNFPRNLHNAMELLMHVGKPGAARRLQKRTNGFFRLLEQGPREGDITGKAHVCFDCGYCGLVVQPVETEPAKDNDSQKACICGHCGSDSHTNLLEIVLPNGRKLPWMERGPTKSTVEAVSQQPVSKGRVKPNEPCPCGSGKKSKKCCHAGGK